jgi:trehalose 6-phosphate phosphatase
VRAQKAQFERAPELEGRCAFFLDLDGTLLDITDHPHHVTVDEDLLRLLKALRTATQGALAVISGRPAADVDRLLANPVFCVAGQHGAERRDFSGTMHRHAVPLAALEEARRRFKAMAAKHPALVLEDKGVNLALHFRTAPGLRAEVLDTARGLAAELGGAFEVQLGKMVVELRPSGKDKGVAIAEFMDEPPFKGRKPVFVGDDLTDEFGFAMINRMEGHSVKVGEGESAARWRLPDSAAVRAWLAGFVERARGAA